MRGSQLSVEKWPLLNNPTLATSLAHRQRGDRIRRRLAGQVAMCSCLVLHIQGDQGWGSQERGRYLTQGWHSSEVITGIG
jgi:hypothetical protein